MVRLHPSPRAGQGCQVTAEVRQAYQSVARREAEALKLQARLKGPYRVGDGECQGEQEGLQDLNLRDALLVRGR